MILLCDKMQPKKRLTKKERMEKFYMQYGRPKPDIIQEGLFPEIPPKYIYLKEKQKINQPTLNQPTLIETKINQLQKQKEEVKEEIKTKKNLNVIHRKNFGIVAYHIATLLDRSDDQRNEECKKFCYNGAKLVYYGMNNIKYGIQKTISYERMILIEKIPDSLFDILNEYEIYAFLVAVWNGKFNRDNNEKYKNAKGAVILREINEFNFQYKLAELINHGKRLLNDHWQYDKLKEDTENNPYEDSWNSLTERIGMIPLSDKILTLKNLNSKCCPPKIKRNGSWSVGFDIECIKNYWKVRNGRHIVRTRDLNEEQRKGITYFVDPRACGRLVLEYFSEREKEWKKWKEDIQI